MGADGEHMIPKRPQFKSSPRLNNVKVSYSVHIKTVNGRRAAGMETAVGKVENSRRDVDEILDTPQQEYRYGLPSGRP